MSNVARFDLCLIFTNAILQSVPSRAPSKQREEIH